MSVEVATGGAVLSPEVANEVTIHQGLGVDEKNEFWNSPITIKDDESSKRCGLLETVPCVFATGNYKMDPDGITETPSITLKRDSSLEVEKLCTYPSPFVAEEPSLRERIAVGSTEELTCSTRIQSGASSLQNEEGDVDVLEDYGTYWMCMCMLRLMTRGFQSWKDLQIKTMRDQKSLSCKRKFMMGTKGKGLVGNFRSIMLNHTK
ncbi:unnamed protein product [Sphagnum tenellum]